MKKVMKFWAEFFAPGTIVANTWTKEFGSMPDPAAVEFPDSAYAFTLHQREDVVIDDSTFTGTSEQVGPMYYHPDSKIETLEEVKKNPASTPALISNMEGNEWGSIVWNRWGNRARPYDEAKAKVLEG